MSVLQHNPNGTHYCHDCGNIVVLFDDDIHECDGRGDPEERQRSFKRGNLEMRQVWRLIDHDTGHAYDFDTHDVSRDVAFGIFADACEAKYPTTEDDDE